jgi:acylphosphatase
VSGSDHAQLHALVDGQVQGVGYRYFVKNAADALALTGWVRNKWDGRVEVLAEGPREALEQLLEKLRRGPSSAFVSDVKIDWNPPGGAYTRFNIAPSE